MSEINLKIKNYDGFKDLVAILTREGYSVITDITRETYPKYSIKHYNVIVNEDKKTD